MAEDEEVVVEVEEPEPVVEVKEPVVEVEVKEPEPEPVVEVKPKVDPLKEWIEKSKEADSAKVIKEKVKPEVDPLKEWIEKSKEANAARVTKERVEAEEAIVVDIETKVAEQYPNSYRVTDWAGHPNYECNKCKFASLDKFKLYSHLIQAHSGIEQDYSGETTHS